MGARRLLKNEERAAAPLLLVEDDDAIREVLREVLQDEGFVVETAATVDEARDVLTRVRPAVVLLDLRLGGATTTSEQLLAELSAVENPQTTVIVSAANKGSDVADAYGVLFVKKPFDIDVLVEKIAQALKLGPTLLRESQLRRSAPPE